MNYDDERFDRETANEQRRNGGAYRARVDECGQENEQTDNYVRRGAIKSSAKNSSRQGNYRAGSYRSGEYGRDEQSDARPGINYRTGAAQNPSERDTAPTYRAAKSYDDDYDSDADSRRTYGGSYSRDRSAAPERRRYERSDDYDTPGAAAYRASQRGKTYAGDTRSRSTARPGSAGHYRTSGRSARRGNAGPIAALAVLIVALIIVIPMAVKNFGRDAQAGGTSLMSDVINSIPTAGVPFDDVFATATPEPLPTDAAGAVITPIPTMAPTEAPTEKPARVLDPNKKAIAITFDDGPSKYTRDILATLKGVDGRATFFVVGERLDEYSAELKMEHEAGNQIGMHTYNHINLTKSSDSKIKQEINDTNDKIYEIIGEKSTILRPPYGSVNKHVKEVVGDLGIPMINWRVDTRDWESRNADSVYNEIMANVSDGMIILMHDIYESTADAVARAVPELVADGYQLCTVDELFELKGIELEPGGLYLSARKKGSE